MERTLAPYLGSRSKTGNPCVRNCCLDEQDVCVGCGRTLEEITGWNGFTDQEKAQVLQQAKKRRDARHHW